jgi:tetratricopeptide (TPR) repeat protein
LVAGHRSLAGKADSATRNDRPTARFALLFVFCFILGFVEALWSQTLFQNTGGAARTIGLGGPQLLGPVDAATALWSPAGLAGLRESEFILAANRPFELSAIGLTGYWPRWGSFGLSLTRFQFAHAKLERASAAWAYSPSRPFSVGLSVHGNRFRQDEFFTATAGAIWHPLGVRLPLSRDPYQAAVFNTPLSQSPLAFAVQASDLALGHQRLAAYYVIGAAARVRPEGPALLASLEWRNNRNLARFGFASPVFNRVALYGGIFDFKMKNAALGLAALGSAYSFDLVYTFADKKFLSGIAFRLGPKASERARQHLTRGTALVKSASFRSARKQLQSYLTYEPESVKVLRLDSALTAQIRREDEKILKLMNEGEMLERRFRYVDAAASYIAVLQINRDDKIARAHLSRLAPQLDLYTKRQYRRAVQLFDDGNYPEAQKLFESILLVGKNYGDTQDYLNRIYTQQREEAEKIFVRGLGYYIQNNYSKAREDFQQALAVSPSYEKAQAYLDSIQTKIDEQRTKIYRLLAEAERLNRRQQFSRAYRAYRQALDLDPANETAKQGMRLLQTRIDAEVSDKLQAANRAFDRSDYSQANDLCRQILDLAPRNEEANAILQRLSRRVEDYVRRGLEYFEAKNWNTAVDEFDKALNIDPKNRVAEQKRQEALSQSNIQQLFEQAQAQYNRGQFLKAIEFYRFSSGKILQARAQSFYCR